MTIHLIRHGSTQGNLSGRYIGVTDEPLCPLGVEELKGRTYPPCERVYASPMLRCVQTARTIYPNVELLTVEGFREINFGEFEGSNYLELSNSPHYQAWIDSNGTLPFPNGESREDFIRRTCDAFNAVVSGLDLNHVSMVVHGGTIMAVMQSLYGGEYFDYQVKNGECVTITI